MCQSGQMKGFKRCFKVEDQGTWRRQNLHAAILRPPAKRIQIKLYKPHLGKEKSVMGDIEPLLGITKPAEGLNKPCQGNVNGRKSVAAEGFNVKIPFISQTYTKAVAISFQQSHTRTRNLVKYHPRVVFTESFHVMVSTDEVCSPCDRHCKVQGKKRHRDRQLSRLTIKKIISSMKKRKARSKLKCIFRKSTPKSSSLYKLCTSQINASTSPCGQPPQAFEFLEIFFSFPPSLGQKGDQMPHPRENYLIIQHKESQVSLAHG